jgi:hypothetical protein
MFMTGEAPAIKPTVPAGIREASTASQKSESGEINMPGSRTFTGTPFFGYLQPNIHLLKGISFHNTNWN